jgi:hypothetical protein
MRRILRTSPTGVPRPLQRVRCIGNCETFVEVHRSAGLSRPLLKFSGGSVDILRDVLH